MASTVSARNVDSLKELAQKEEAESLELQAKAQKEILSINVSDYLSASLGDNLSEVHLAVDELHSVIAKTIHGLLLNAMKRGFETDIKGRAELQNKAAGTMKVDVDLDDSDFAPLREYPVLGHTVLQIALHLADNARFDLTTLSGGPNRGEFDPSQLPKQVDQRLQVLARTVARTLDNAHIAGSKYSQDLMGKASAYTN